MGGGRRSEPQSVELRHLRYFVTLAEELHFGRAAERLKISQPPLSQQIARLEKELGVRLLSRTSRSVDLTAAGRLFLIEARRTLAQAEQAVHVARRAELGEVGQLQVGFVAACGSIPLSVRRFLRRHPGVRVSLMHMSTADQLAALADRRLDVAFVHLPIEAGPFEAEPVQSHPLVAAIPSRHRLAGSGSVAWRALEGEPFIGFPRESAPAAYDAIVAHLRRVGFTPNVVHSTDSLQARLRFVGAGIGISLIPAYAERLSRPGVVLRPLKPPQLHAAIGMVHDPTRVSPALARFLVIARSASGRA